MAAPTYGAAGTYLENESTTQSFAAPASVGVNSIVIITGYVDGTTDPGIALPGGFTHAEGSPVFIDDTPGIDPPQNHWLVVAWHRASGSESGPYVMTTTSTRFVDGQAHRIDGCVTTGTPFDTPTSSNGTVSNSTTSPTVSLTTAGADRLLLHAATSWAGGTWTAPTGFTKRMQGGVGLATLADKAQAAAGGTGSVTATCSGSDKMQAWLGALIPAGGGAAATSMVIPRRAARGLILR